MVVREKTNLLENIATQIRTRVIKFVREIENYYFSESQTPAVVVAYTPANIAAAGIDWQGLAYFPKEEINSTGERK